MVQLNLLPEVKLTYVKTNRLKRLVTSIAVIVALVTLGLTILLFVAVNVVQKLHMDNLNNQIQGDTSALQNTPNLTKILTVQNQLNTLPTIYKQDPKSSLLFTYLSELTPVQATISQFSLNFTPTDSISITGSADSLATVNKFVDTLQFSNYKVNGGKPASAFSDVTLSSFGYTSSQGANYTITANFDPTIFTPYENVSLVIPNLITTRSELDQPSILFQPQSNSSSSTTSSSNATNQSQGQ